MDSADQELTAHNVLSDLLPTLSATFLHATIETVWK